MRVSELAKQLGYRAAELVELAKDRGLPIKSATTIGGNEHDADLQDP